MVIRVWAYVTEDLGPPLSHHPAWGGVVNDPQAMVIEYLRPGPGRPALIAWGQWRETIPDSGLTAPWVGVL